MTASASGPRGKQPEVAEPVRQLMAVTAGKTYAPNSLERLTRGPESFIMTCLSEGCSSSSGKSALLSGPAGSAARDTLLPPPPPQVAGRVSRIGTYLRLLRCEQWLKNAFVFGPVIFAGELLSLQSTWLSLLAFVSLSLIASAIYVFNDWCDRHVDAIHPEKRSRPLACGAVSGREACLLSLAALALGLAISYATLPWQVRWLQAAFLALNIVYTLRLKHEVILDVFAVALGFILRVLIGAYAIAAPASHWLILCTFFLAMFLGFCKRENELSVLERNSAAHRSVLAIYTGRFASEMNLVALAASLLCYGLYTVSNETIVKFGTDRLVYSVPVVSYGLFRYLFLVRVKGLGGNPGKLVLKDRALQGCIVAWLAFCILVVYL